MTTPLDRRNFLRDTFKYAGGALIAAPSLAGLAACNDLPAPSEPGGPHAARARRSGAGGYGPLAVPPGDLTLAIPAGFTIRRISRTYDDMKRPGAGKVPNAFDGMASFPMANGNIRLIRNHEIRDAATAAGVAPLGSKPWDARAYGGCTSLEVRVDPATGEPTVVDEFVSISGTCVNCAGGPTPWGTWLTCEETVEGTAQGRDRNHGYVFEIPASASDEVTPVSLNAMGRFSHEAVAVDRTYGHVYETEDAGATTSGFYRFIPNVLGDLRQGGRLQMLAVEGRPQINTGAGGIPPLVPLPARWVDIDNPDPATITSTTSCFAQGLAKGGARFARLEGCWWGDDSVYFNATSGGAAGAGQVWQYRALSADVGQLMLVFESPSAAVLDSPDNICTSPRGGLVICEDGGGDQYVRGLTRQGQIFDLVRTTSPAEDSEFAGACFSPDGRILFFNQQGSTAANGADRGATYALWGPWETGAL
jgi:secreted PhoX family phosphatase